MAARPLPGKRTRNEGNRPTRPNPTAARRTARRSGETGFGALLLRGDAGLSACRATATRTALVVVPMGPAAPGGSAAATLTLRWDDLRSWSADGTASDGRGRLLQVLELVTAGATVALMAPAADLAPLVARLPAGRRPPIVRSVDTVRGVLLAALAAVLAAAAALAGAVAPAAGRLTRSRVGAMVAAAVQHAGEAWTRLPLHRWLPDPVKRHGRPLAAGGVSLALVAGMAATFALGASGPVASGAARYHPVAVTGVGPVTTPAMSHLLGDVPRVEPATTPPLPAAAAPPAPAPPSLASASPLTSHEVFGFAPYWTLPDSGTFDVQGLTTIAYFAIPVNANGTLDHSGAGWNGYQSQALANLVTRAHAAGDRVVLTVNDFDQSSLDALTSSPTAAATLASALVAAVQAKNLDGVNLDFEGEGPGDQAGLTKLVAFVSATLHLADPHWQLTMDTYASSAGDPGGFYNIKALAPYVDAFFVMAYQLNLQSPPNPASPITSALFSDKETATQYTAAVSPSKVILGLPFYGIDLPTTNGTMAATATGGATPMSYGEIVAAGHPTYWDPVTDTAWTSYQVGNQWHETFFEDPTSLYMAAKLAQAFQLGGVGIWALGMDNSGSGLLASLDGFAPVLKVANPPTTTTTSTTTTTTAPTPGSSGSAPSTTTTTTSPSGTAGAAPAASGTGGPSGGDAGGSGGSTGGSSGGSTGTAPPPTYSGQWQGQTVQLTDVGQIPTEAGSPVGQLTGFTTDDPSLACLESEPDLGVWQDPLQADTYEVIALEPTDCANAAFTFTFDGTTGGTGTGGSTSGEQAQDSTPTTVPGLP